MHVAAGMEHGPWRSAEGSLTFEVRYLDQNKNGQ